MCYTVAVPFNRHAFCVMGMTRVIDIGQSRRHSCRLFCIRSYFWCRLAVVYREVGLLFGRGTLTGVFFVCRPTSLRSARLWTSFEPIKGIIMATKRLVLANQFANMANLPEGFVPVTAPEKVSAYIKLAKKGDFVTGEILSRAEREDKYNPGKMELNFFIKVEACESHKREQDEQGNWVASKDTQDTPAGSTVSLKASGSLRRLLSQIADGKRVHIAYDGIEMVPNKDGIKVKSGKWIVGELPNLKKDGDVPF